LVNGYASNADLFDQPASQRDYHLRKGFAPFDVTQAFKTNFIYELPFGRGKMFMSDAHGLVNGLLGDWTFNGNVRLQTGSPFSLGNVQVVGMSVKVLQNMVGVYRNERNSDGSANTREVYLLPAEVRINTFRANNTTFTAAGPVHTHRARRLDGLLLRGSSAIARGLRRTMRDTTTWFSKDQRSSALT
jgi:hypothetical protein